MSFLWPFITDRRLVLLGLIGALALVLSFVTLSSGQSLQVMIYGGYWIMLTVSGLFGWSLYKLVRRDWRGIEVAKSIPRWPFGLILFCGGLLLVHEAYGFKILMDEIMLLGTSMSLHFEKIALVAMRGHNIQGTFQVLGGELDKRPLFQPFLVSILHDVTGYRPENVFVLNTALTFVLLTLTYRVGCSIAGRAAGTVAVLLLTSLPLLAQNATGGGFEILNLVMILSTLLLGMRYMRQRDSDSLEAFGLSGILLALTRYESAIYLLPVALTVLWAWCSDRKATLSWMVIVMPFFLIPCVLQNKVFSVHSSAWEMGSRPGYEKPFSFAYIPENIAHDLNFFFSTNGENSNSLVLSILGFLALPFFVLWVVKILRNLSKASSDRGVLAIFAIGFAAHSLLLLCYFWGKFDDPVIRRLSLPINVLLVIATVVVASEMNFRGRIWSVLGAVIGFGIFAQSLPTMARHSYSAEYYYGREVEWRRQFIAQHPEKDYLFIDNSSIFWVTHLVSATTMQQARDYKGNIIFNQRNRIFSAIYVFQRYNVDPATGALSVQGQLDKEDDDLGPDYQLETLAERRFTPLTVSRISRVIAIHEGISPALRIHSAVSLEKTTPEEREKIRQAYLQNFVKLLP